MCCPFTISWFRNAISWFLNHDILVQEYLGSSNPEYRGSGISSRYRGSGMPGIDRIRDAPLQMVAEREHLIAARHAMIKGSGHAGYREALLGKLGGAKASSRLQTCRYSSGNSSACAGAGHSFVCCTSSSCRLVQMDA